MYVTLAVFHVTWLLPHCCCCCMLLMLVLKIRP